MITLIITIQKGEGDWNKLLIGKRAFQAHAVDLCRIAHSQTLQNAQSLIGRKTQISFRPAKFFFESTGTLKKC